MSLFKITIVVMLWAVALWRLPSAIRIPQQRSLWIAFTCLALAATLSGQAGQPFDQAAGINNLSVLAKHTIGIIACGAVFDFVLSMARPALVARTRLPHVILASCVMALMAVLFSQVDQPTEVENFYQAYARVPAATAYLLTFTSYLGIAMALATWLFLAYAPRTDTPSLRHGLRLLGIGTGVGAVYAAIRVADLTAQLAHWGFPLSEDTTQQVADLVQYTAIALIVLGNSLPAAGILARTGGEWRDSRKLTPLWSALTQAVPDIVLPLTSRRSIRVRLHRTVIEIRDACRELTPYAPAGARERAEQAARDAGLHGEAADTTAEALWLRATRDAKLHGSPPLGAPTHPGPERQPGLEGVDLQAEVRRLLLLSEAYHSDLAASFATTVSEPS